MKPEFIIGNEKTGILRKLEIYGISKIPYLLLRFGKDRIRAYSGNLNPNDINKLYDNVYIETIGIYFAKYDGNDIKLSVDAVHLLKEQITENILELTDQQVAEYLMGRDVELNKEQLSQTQDKKIYFILKHNEDFLGMGKVSQGMLKNYLPKERRRRN